MRVDPALRHRLEREIAPAHCATCNDLRNELINAREVALHLMAELRKAHPPKAPPRSVRETRLRLKVRKLQRAAKSAESQTEHDPAQARDG